MTTDDELRRIAVGIGGLAAWIQHLRMRLKASEKAFRQLYGMYDRSVSELFRLEGRVEALEAGGDDE